MPVRRSLAYCRRSALRRSTFTDSGPQGKPRSVRFKIISALLTSVVRRTISGAQLWPRATAFFSLLKASTTAFKPPVGALLAIADAKYKTVQINTMNRTGKLRAREAGSIKSVLPVDTLGAYALFAEVEPGTRRAGKIPEPVTVKSTGGTTSVDCGSSYQRPDGDWFVSSLTLESSAFCDLSLNRGLVDDSEVRSIGIDNTHPCLPKCRHFVI